MPKGRILIVDDEPVIAEALSELLEGWGYETAVASDGLLGLAAVEEFRPSVVVSDVYMPNLDGFGLLREMRELHPETAVILLTGQGTVEMALRAIQEEGAFHYFEKPIDFAKLRLVVERAVEYAEARRENLALRLQLRDRGAFGELVGASEPMRQIYALIEQVAPSSASVLITGESGTGKELCARTIHNLSPRKNNAFVAINCSAIPETLMESELFGHERGAFTGAAARRLGCFELANGGTLLLDEIAEMPVSLQAKLLRVLEDRKIRRLGGDAGAVRGRARAGGDEPRPAGGRARAARSAKTCSTASTSSRSSCRRCASAGRTSRCSRSTSSRSSPSATSAPRASSAPRRSRRSSRTTGPATSASCATSSSAPSSSARARSSSATTSRPTRWSSARARAARTRSRSPSARPSKRSSGA